MVQNVDMTGNSQLVTFGGGVPVYGVTNPSGAKPTGTTTVGNTMADSGTINLQMVAAGKAPSATGADKVVATYLLPAGTFDQFGRGINLCAGGTFTSNANNKRIKIIVNPTVSAVDGTVTDGTTIADTGTQTTGTSGTGWQLTANIFKTGAQGSNTQLSIHEAAQFGAVIGGLLAPSSLTLNESVAIPVVVTINNGTTAGDSNVQFFQTVGYN